MLNKINIGKFASYHPLSQRIGITYSLVDRAVKSHPRHHLENLDFIKKPLLENDYLPTFLEKHIST